MTPNDVLPRVVNLMKHLAARKARPGLAPDVVQEAVIVFYHLWDWYDQDPAHLPVFTSWCVLRAVRKVCRRSAVQRLTVDLGEDLDLPVLDPPAPLEAAEERAAAAGQVARLRAGLDRLTAPQRDVVTRLYGLDGGKPARARDIARARGCRDENVRCLRAAALGRLRKAVSQ